jgi:hypothetical protein
VIDVHRYAVFSAYAATTFAAAVYVGVDFTSSQAELLIPSYALTENRQKGIR